MAAQRFGSAPTSLLSVRIEEIFYFLFFSCLLFAKGIGLYDGQLAFKIFLLLGLVFWFGKMAVTEFCIKELIIIFVLILLGGSTYLISGDKGVLLYILMVTGSKNISLDKIFKVGMVTLGISFFSLFLLTSTHLLDSPFQIHAEAGLGLIIRWGLGYAHPNILHITFLILIFFAVYLLKDRYRWKWAALFMVCNLYIYFYSFSATGILTVTVYLGLSLYWTYQKGLSVTLKIMLRFILPFCLLFSFLTPLMVKNEHWFQLLNTIMNQRLILSRYFLAHFPFSLFGSRITQLQTPVFTIDNSYVYAYIVYGAVLSALIIFAYFITINRFIKEGKGAELCILIAILISGLTEPYLFNTSFKNISLLFFGMLLFQSNPQKRSFVIFSVSHMQFTIPAGGLTTLWRSSKRMWFTCGKKILTAGTAAGVIAASGYYLLAGQPQSYIAPLSLCSDKTLDPFFLPSATGTLHEGARILDYLDAQTPMITVTGNIIIIEKLRNTLTCGVLIFLLVSISVFAWTILKRHREAIRS